MRAHTLAHTPYMQVLNMAADFDFQWPGFLVSVFRWTTHPRKHTHA